MGYLSDGKIYDFDTPLDLLRFKPLSFRDKLRFGIEVFYKIPSGEKVFNTIWKPLLIHKFGDYWQNIPMKWIYSRPASNGKLGYIEGSTQVLIDKLSDKIKLLGGDIIFNTEIDTDKYHMIIDTTPSMKNQLSVICLVIVLDRPLTKYYWLNIGDLSFPFGLIVQKGNVVYIVNYGKPKGDCIAHLDRINPEFDKSWIKEIHVFKDDYAQPWDAELEERGLNNIIAKARKTVLWAL
jgi:hypothetical protein